MSKYSNPTENATVSTVGRKIRMIRSHAEQIRIRRRKGLLTADE